MAGLAVSGVDFRIAQNAEEHITSRYELVHLSQPSPVLRRGQKFTIHVYLRNGPINLYVHGLTILFNLDNAPSPNTFHGTRGEARLNNDHVFGWKATLKENNANYAVIEVQSPPTAPVGVWTVKFLTWYNRQVQNEYTYPGKVYLLFHPWNSVDQVFMPDQQLLDEYVFSDLGKLYQKIGKKIVTEPWVFGQFDKSSLLASMRALRLSGLLPHEFRDPVKVSRAVTNMANSMGDDGGILVGKWEGEFERENTHPREWTSSIDILKKYLETGAAVRYGQCWVFAGIVTTVCRALGLPCRPVTMIESPHDDDDDLAISMFFDENNKMRNHDIYSRGEDTAWSFHVWNEVWMARPDLPRGFSGWQAIDGTPQSRSDGKLQCGPAPLEAIKKGQTGMPFDVKTFIVASNADLLHWKQTNGEFQLIKAETGTYGLEALTKKPNTYDPNGDTDRDDVIHNYKFPEGSQGERLFLMTAVAQNPKARFIYNIPEQPWKDDLAIEAANVPYVPLGQTLQIPFKIKNKSGTNRQVRASITADSRYYNGAHGHHLGQVEGSMTLSPGQEQVMVLPLNQSDYVGKLVEYGAVSVYGAVSIVDNIHTWIKEVETGFQVPQITFEQPQDVRMGQRSILRLSIKNPLSVAMTICRFLFHAPNVNIVREIPYRSINPQEEVRLEAYFQPLKQGGHTITATFSCRETMNFLGRVKIQV